MVPQMHDIDISKYMEITAEQGICVTPPAQNHHAKKPFSVRRKRNPVILNLDKISMTFNDDEDTSKNLDSLVLVEEVNKLFIQDQKNLEIHDKKKLIKTSKTSKQSAENENISSEVKIVRGKHTKPLMNEVHGMRTRSNIRKLEEKPS